MRRPCEGEACLLESGPRYLRYGGVKINCIRMADTDLIIALRNNWSYGSQRI